ncbi:MAG: TatD family hydrolase [Candidatus Fimivivens sp.]
MISFFDSHAHYDQKRFDDDREAVIASLPATGVGAVLNSASDIASSEAALALAQKHLFFRTSAGVHPHSAADLDDNALLKIEQLCREPEVVAIGEIGLDYYYNYAPKEVQQTAFRRQLELAHELDYPVIIHSRDAAQDTFDLVKEFCPRGVVHCFSGSAQLAREYAAMGLYLGFTGVVTFKNAKKPFSAAASVPRSQLLIETDCPYMAPEPFRGRRCDSTMLSATAAALAAAQNCDVETLAQATWQNTINCFSLQNWRPQT